MLSKFYILQMKYLSVGFLTRKETEFHSRSQRIPNDYQRLDEFVRNDEKK